MMSKLMIIIATGTLFSCETLNPAIYERNVDEKSGVASDIDIPIEDPLEEVKERLRQSRGNIYSIVHDIFNKNFSERNILDLLRYCIDEIDKKVVKKRDSKGWTLLHHAIRRNYFSIVFLLLVCNSNVNAQDLLGNTPLHYAVNRNNLKITKLLIQNGADVNAQNLFGNTPLHYALEQCSLMMTAFDKTHNSDNS